MKLSKWQLKYVAVLLAFLFLFQNCKIYHKQSVSVSEAVESGKRVRIYFDSKENSSFYKLLSENNDLIALSKRNVRIVDFLQPKIIDTILIGKKKYVRIALNENEIVKIRLQNEKGSKVVSIVVPIVSVAGAFAILTVIAMHSISLSGMAL